MSQRMTPEQIKATRLQLGHQLIAHTVKLIMVEKLAEGYIAAGHPSGIAQNWAYHAIFNNQWPQRRRKAA